MSKDKTAEEIFNQYVLMNDPLERDFYFTAIIKAMEEYASIKLSEKEKEIIYLSETCDAERAKIERLKIIGSEQANTISSLQSETERLEKDYSDLTTRNIQNKERVDKMAEALGKIKEMIDNEYEPFWMEMKEIIESALSYQTKKEIKQSFPSDEAKDETLRQCFEKIYRGTKFQYWEEFKGSKQYGHLSIAYDIISYHQEPIKEGEIEDLEKLKQPFRQWMVINANRIGTSDKFFITAKKELGFFTEEQLFFRYRKDLSHEPNKKELSEMTDNDKLQILSIVETKENNEKMSHNMALALAENWLDSLFRKDTYKNPLKTIKLFQYLQSRGYNLPPYK